MDTATKSQIVKIISKKNRVRVVDLTRALGISPQAIHRHLKELTQSDILQKSGRAPTCFYELAGSLPVPHNLKMGAIVKQCSKILSGHPDVLLVTLFGSQARGDSGPHSDIDLLIWLTPNSVFSRQDIWRFWDRHAREMEWKDKASLIVRRWSNDIYLDTLLLDFPEEHRVLYDAKNYYPVLKHAVISWRKKWHSKKLPSFGGTHAWKYSTTAKNLADIDFRLEIKNDT